MSLDGGTSVVKEPRDTLDRLLRAPPAAREAAWRAFLEQFNDLILYAISRTERDEDAVADAYAYVLEQIRRDDFRRLRAFEVDGPARFGTWLVVVVRRLVIDHRRRVAGRTPAHVDIDDGLDPRRRFGALASAVSDPEDLADESTPDPLAAVQSAEVLQALSRAVAELDPRDRLLLSLRFEDGHSARVIAEAMSFESQFHVYRRLRSVLGELRTSLAEAGIGSSRG
jgi:RNA polymerase sigma factor (sigma-70 family)